MQGEWIGTLLDHMKASNVGTVDPSKDSEEKWAEDIWTLANASLLPTTKSVRAQCQRPQVESDNANISGSGT